MQIVDTKHTNLIQVGRDLVKRGEKETGMFTTWDPDHGERMENFSDLCITNHGRTVRLSSNTDMIFDTLLGAAIEYGFKYVGLQNTYATNPDTDNTPYVFNPFRTEMTFFETMPYFPESYAYFRPLEDLDADMLEKISVILKEQTSLKWHMFMIAQIEPDDPKRSELIEHLAKHDWKSVSYRNAFYYSESSRYRMVVDTFQYKENPPLLLGTMYAKDYDVRKPENLILLDELGNEIAYGADAIIQA